jgi:ketosteroid isomerase-like protein
MPDRNILDDFITTVVSGRYDEAIERYYTSDATMQENLDPPRRGRSGLVTHERGVMAAFKSIKATCVSPVFADGDHVVVRWVFEFERADGGKMRMDELAYQRWAGNKIAEERFYYDPKQMLA